MVKRSCETASSRVVTRSKLDTAIIVIVLRGTSPGEPPPVSALVTTLNPSFTEKNDGHAKAEEEEDDRNGGDAACR